MSDPALEMTTDLIAGFEGFRSAPYKDSVGRYTIGFGFTYNEDGSRVTMQTHPMSEATAKERLSEIVSKTIVTVRGMIHVPVTNHQIAACTSLSFNMGTNAIRCSKLISLLNQGKTDAAAKEFGGWVYAAGRVVPGLVNRRKAEMAFFLTPDVAE